MNTPLLRACVPRLSRAVAAAATRRTYAFQASGAPVFEVFNRRIKWLQKERAASNVEGSRQADYLKDEVAIRLCERLLVSSPLLPRPSLGPSSVLLPSGLTSLY